MKDPISALLDFTTAIEQLKKIERFKGQYYWKDYPKLERYESVADHTWRLGVIVMLFEKKLSKPLNIERALKMVMVHDLPEVYAGDASPMGTDGKGLNTHAYNKNVQASRHQKEQQAAETLFGKLPKDLKHELYSLWLEYEEQSSFEAQVVKALDKIECLLQVFEYRKGHLFKEHLDFNISYGLKYADVDPSIKAYADSIVVKLKKNFKEFVIAKPA